MKKNKWNKLTPQEAYVIQQKGTERAFTGDLYDNKKTGVYVCRQCENPLYISEDKFDSRCGWPSFDDEIPNAIKKLRDADGYRVEIVCNNCDGHLGHVFEGERFTEKNTRHCVNSISMIFENETKTDVERAVFGAGCFWSKQWLFEQQNGVFATRVGFSGGNIKMPTSQQVSTGNTGHTEVVEVFFYKNKTSFENLAKLFFKSHNFSDTNRQTDKGGKYKSVIFYTDENQKNIAESLVEELKSQGLEVVTEIKKVDKIYAAEAHHQHYHKKLNKTPEIILNEEIFV